MKKNKKLTDEEVMHIANLARLILTTKELKKYGEQLIKIFDYIDQIGEMKTKKVEETSHPIGNNNVLREDKIDTSKMLSQEEALSNASSTKKGYFKVKAIFEQQ